MSDLPTSRARVIVRLLHPFPLPDGNLLPRSLEGIVLAVFGDRMDIDFSMDSGEPIVATVPNSWLELVEAEPPDELVEQWAIVECLGHQTLIGRVSEAERFGACGILVEPLFDGVLLAAVFRSAAALYGVTPCTREQAYASAPRDAARLPVAVRALIPPALRAMPHAANEDLRLEQDFDDTEPLDPDTDGPLDSPRRGTTVTLLREFHEKTTGVALAYGTRGRVIDYEPDGRIAVAFACGDLTFDAADLSWDRGV